MIKSWSAKPSREVFRSDVFRINTHWARSPRTDEEHQFFVFDMPDWVNVVALPDPQHVLMVRQYRHGSGDVTLEIPGGMIDPSDSSPEAAARRELLEETGYEAVSVQQIGVTAPNPALQNNRCYTCTATELRDTGAPRLDGAEDIELVKIKLDDVPGLLRQGAISHSLVVVAFCWHFGIG